MDKTDTMKLKFLSSQSSLYITLSVSTGTECNDASAKQYWT